MSWFMAQGPASIQWRELAPGLTVRFVSISTLIAMKQLANRPRDLDDIEHLRMIMEEKRRNESGR